MGVQCGAEQRFADQPTAGGDDDPPVSGFWARRVASWFAEDELELCPECGSPIKSYDNVPVLSWIILRGKCRNCRIPISPMYPSIEFATALLFIACYLSFGLSIATLKWLFFSSILVVLIVTDYRERILPDLVNWFGVGVFGAMVAMSLQLFALPFVWANGGPFGTDGDSSAKGKSAATSRNSAASRCSSGEAWRRYRSTSPAVTAS